MPGARLITQTAVAESIPHASKGAMCPLLRCPLIHVSLTDMNKGARRTYRMDARAEAAAETGERILDAAIELFWEQPTDPFSLDDIARRAGVSPRTVIRRFGGRDGLTAAAGARAMERTRRQRDAPVGDLPTAVSVLVDHYELMGDQVLRMLAAEQSIPGLSEMADQGRSLHRDWCAQVFAPTLEDVPPAERRRRLAQLVTICDVYTWKLLRRDSGLSRQQTELALVEILHPLIKES